MDLCIIHAMTKRVPVSVARQVAESQGMRQVILLCWDGTTNHIVTYGKTVEDCAQAADGGNMLKRKWGWPESTICEPPRVKKLQDRIKELENKLAGDPA